MTTCPWCHGLLRREPAVMSCRICGRSAPVTDATKRAWVRQLLLDWSLRPRSVECLKPGEDGWWPSAKRPGKVEVA